MGLDHVIMELCYKGTILQRNYSHNYFVEFYGKKNGSHNMTMLYLICVII